jgi:membrane fusion protein (multidrug efflux system)
MAQRRRSTAGRTLRTLAGVLALAVLAAAGYYGYTTYLAPAGGGGQKAAGKGRPPPTVTTARAKRTDWQPALNATGTLTAVRGVEVAPEINGIVQEVGLESGATVEQGEMLVRMRAPELKAGLRQLKARREEAKSAYERAQRLYDQGNAPKARLDETRARYRSLDAQIAEQRARIQKKTVRAPFGGQLGISEVDRGQYLTPGQPLVTLQDLTPMHVDFSVPEQHLPDIKPGQQVTVRVDAYPERTFEGEVTAIDPEVRVETRNVPIQATLENPERRLRPGMFARVKLDTGTPRQLVTLPQTAIVTNPYGSSVYVVKRKDGRKLVHQQMVETGSQRGTQVAVTKGLDGGETVVTSGQIKLREGIPVQVDNSTKPANTPVAQVEEP